MNRSHPRIVVVMGVSGCGKTAIGRLLADRIGRAFFDADDFHPAENIAKMSRGVPLDDADRLPWLERLRDEVMDSGETTVLACSALRRSYREALGMDREDVSTVFLYGDEAVLEERLSARAGHYMKQQMLASQLDALEEPGESEALRFPITLPPEEIVGGIIRAFFLEL
jgi:gluconokinase